MNEQATVNVKAKQRIFIKSRGVYVQPGESASLSNDIAQKLASMGAVEIIHQAPKADKPVNKE
jgi:hypothetical protein